MVATVGAGGLERREGLAAEDDGEHDRQAAERRDHPADDRDRAEVETREVGQVRARADEPEERRDRDRAPGRSAASCPVDERAGRRISTALTNCMPAVTRRLPMTRLARAVMTSRVPQDKAAARPVRSPKGIDGAYGPCLIGRRRGRARRADGASRPAARAPC